MEILGTSTMGLPFPLLLLSSPENLEPRRRREIMEVERRLSDARTMRDAEEREKLMKGQPAVIVAYFSIHSPEVSGYNAALQLVDHFARSNNPESLGRFKQAARRIHSPWEN